MFDRWLFDTVQRLDRWNLLNLEKFDDGRSALLHFSEGLAWSGFWCVLIDNKWLLGLTACAWLGFVLWYEMFEDGHFERIFVTGPESFDELFGPDSYTYAHRDMCADLLTKLAGLLLYIPAFFR